jgi:MFS family permease
VPPPAVTASAGGRRLVLAGACLAVLAIGDNSTAIMAALPALARALGLAGWALEWAVNAYLLASASFIVLGGLLADRFGPRLSSAAGCALFGLASVIIALSPDAALLLAGRALQGLGAAFAVAGTLAVAGATTAAAQPAAIGAWTGFLMLGFSLGPLVGGFLTHTLGWEANFWLNLPLMLVAAGLLLAARSKEAAAAESHRIDWPGLVLLASFMTALIVGLQALPKAASAPAAAALPLLVAAGALAALLAVEARTARPLVELGFFARRGFAFAAAVLFFSMLNIMTLLLYYNLYAQGAQGLGYSPVDAGLSLLPLSVALFGFARAAPWLAARLGLRLTMSAGGLLTVLGLFLVQRGVAGGGGPVLAAVGLFVTGAGIALPYASAPRVGLATLDQAQSGQGSGMLNSCSFLGGTVGVTAGGIAYGLAGFTGALAVVAAAALAIAALSALYGAATT